jgi:hypothetical protein
MRLLLTLLIALAIATAAIACSSDGPERPSAQRDRTEDAEQFLRSGQLPDVVNYIDRENFTRWLEMSDDPTNILWCTLLPFGHEKVTVPVVGKLTDSGKTPFPTRFQWTGGGEGTRFRVAEEADPFAMYGVSTDFLYGFDPIGQFQQVTASVPMYCTTEPKVWQRTESTIVLEGDPVLSEISERAREALAAGEGQHALDILEEAAQ